MAFGFIYHFDTILIGSKIAYMWEIDSKKNILMEIISCGFRLFNGIGMQAQEETSRGLMQGINMEKSSQGCYKAIQIGFCDSYHNKIIDVQNRLPYSKVVYPAIIVLSSCLMEVNHGGGSRPNYPFRKIKLHFEVVPWYIRWPWRDITT